MLVGTAAPDLDLNRNPCARALSEAAGQNLQQQCTKIAPIAEGDIAVVSQTGRLDCQAVTFAVCSQWNGGRGKQVLRLFSYYILLIFLGSTFLYIVISEKKGTVYLQ